MFSEMDKDKAQDIVDENRVSKLVHEELPVDDFYLVTGKASDYIVVYPDYCSCTHFIVKCVKTPEKICKHILAVQMSRDKSLRKIEIHNIQEFYTTQLNQ